MRTLPGCTVMVEGVNRYRWSVVIRTSWTPFAADAVVEPVRGSRLIADWVWQPAGSPATASTAAPERRARGADGRSVSTSATVPVLAVRADCRHRASTRASRAGRGIEGRTALRELAGQRPDHLTVPGLLPAGEAQQPVQQPGGEAPD